MGVSTLEQTIQLSAWFLALLEFILGFYILALNTRHTANRHVSASLLLLAVNTFAAGSLIAINNTEQAYIILLLLAITTPAIPPMLLVVAVALLKPVWLKNRLRWLWRLVYAIVALPALLVMVDLTLGTNFWFSPIDPSLHIGGYIALLDYTQGSLSHTIRLVSFTLIPAVTLLLTLYFALFDKQLSTINRKLAWLLFSAEATAVIIHFYLLPSLILPVGSTISSAVWAFTYAYAAFQQMISERRPQTGSLQGRLTALILIVTLPLLIAINLLVTSNAKATLEQNALDNIRTVHQSIAASVNLWQGFPTSSLEVIENQVKAYHEEQNGVAYVINQHNQVLAHSDQQLSTLQVDFSQYAPIATLRSQVRSSKLPLGDKSLTAGINFSFIDEHGTKWRAHGSVLENNWAIIVQIPEKELFTPIYIFQRFSWVALAVGILLILTLAILTIRQGLQPIEEITKTATAIAGGDLTKVAPIQSEGEFGILANAFNNMTSQLRELIANLERRVTDRTRELEQRALQLQVAAEVASEAAAIRDLERLLDHTVYLISNRFDFYHAGIFLIDDTRKYAVLRSASSEGGQHMLNRGHKLEVGQKGIVGYVAGKGEPRIALDVGEDAVYFNNPDMPRTRSEMALPLVVRQEVIGVLDVQSIKASAFTEDDLAILQILADQIALALDNARLLAESMHAFNELETSYKREFSQAWLQRLVGQNISYTYNQLGVQTTSESDFHKKNNEGSHVLKLPLSFRGLSLGSVTLRKGSDQPPWSVDDVQLVKTTISQIVLALENARLMEEIRRRAHNEQILNQISASAHTSLDLETVMKKAVKEISQAIGAAKVQIRLGNEESAPETTPSPELVPISES